MTYQEFLDGLQEIERPLIAVYEQILEELKPKKVLEIGAGWGLFARVVLEKSKATLTEIDKIPASRLPDWKYRTEGFEDRILFINADSADAVPALTDQYDLIFVDGDHGFNGVMKDLENLKEKLASGGVILIDDVFHLNNWSVQQDRSFNYGITRAVWVFANDQEIPSFRIYAVAHGLARIDL